MYVKRAAAGFPEVELNIGRFAVRARVPTGADQEAIAELNEDAAAAFLLRACLVAVDARPAEDAFVSGLDKDAIESIELAIDKAAPAVSTAIQVVCPGCGKQQVIEVDPYSLMDPAPRRLFHEVHYLACHYHWGEEEILNLPGDRRRMYMRLIDQSRNMVT